jgi:hypothetical protein
MPDPYVYMYIYICVCVCVCMYIYGITRIVNLEMPKMTEVAASWRDHEFSYFLKTKFALLIILCLSLLLRISVQILSACI